MTTQVVPTHHQRIADEFIHKVTPSGHQLPVAAWFTYIAVTYNSRTSYFFHLSLDSPYIQPLTVQKENDCFTTYILRKRIDCKTKFLTKIVFNRLSPHYPSQALYRRIIFEHRIIYEEVLPTSPSIYSIGPLTIQMLSKRTEESDSVGRITLTEQIEKMHYLQLAITHRINQIMLVEKSRLSILKFYLRTSDCCMIEFGKVSEKCLQEQSEKAELKKLHKLVAVHLNNLEQDPTLRLEPPAQINLTLLTQGSHLRRIGAPESPTRQSKRLRNTKKN